MSTDRRSTTEKQAAQMKRMAGLRTVEEAEAELERAIAEKEGRRPRVETGERSDKPRKAPPPTERQAARMLGRSVP